MYVQYFLSEVKKTTPEHPILVLDNAKQKWEHHSEGFFTNPNIRTAFEFDTGNGSVSGDIKRIDARFVNLIRWLGEHHIRVRLSERTGKRDMRYTSCVRLPMEGGGKLSASDGFLQFMIDRLLASSAPSGNEEEEDEDADGDEMKLTSLQSITDFMQCAGRTLPDNIRLWARRNLAVARSHEVSPEERRHAQRALPS